MKRNGKRRIGRGFTLIELMLVIMLIGILASYAVARFLNARDRSYVAAAVYDLDLVRKMLAYYSVDWSTYPAAVASYDDLRTMLVDTDGRSYGNLPISNTFEFVSYALDANDDYVLRVRAADNPHTILVATPEFITRE